MSTVPNAGPAVKVDALTWATGITIIGVRITPPGPSLEELDALLAARGVEEAPKPAPAPKPRQEPARATWANAWKPSAAESAAMRAAVESFDRAVDEAYARSYPAEAATKAEAPAPDAYAEVHEHLEACDGHLADFHRNMAEFDRQIAAFDATVAEIREDEDSDPATWPAWCDDDRWELGPEPTDHDWSEYARWSEGNLEHDEAPALAMPLDAWIEAEARRYRDLRTQAGELVADALVELAASVRLTQATTPRTARDRIEALEARHAVLAAV